MVKGGYVKRQYGTMMNGEDDKRSAISEVESEKKYMRKEKRKEHVTTEKDRIANQEKD